MSLTRTRRRWGTPAFLAIGVLVSGGGNPMYKTKQDWWAPPEYMNVEYSEVAMDVMQEVLYEQIPEIVNKHADAIAARYKEK